MRKIETLDNEPAWNEISLEEKKQLAEYLEYTDTGAVADLSFEELEIQKIRLEGEIKEILEEIKKLDKTEAEGVKMRVAYLEEVSNIMAKLLGTGQIIRLELRQ
ncbi:MAG: hypothetical protein K8Q91_01485 [Candidatus Vogelbacteria bacterium]|nr:hypothetical protein [Candidatus Vogelbacteria bacterium]